MHQNSLPPDPLSTRLSLFPAKQGRPNYLAATFVGIYFAFAHGLSTKGYPFCEQTASESQLNPD